VFATSASLGYIQTSNDTNFASFFLPEEKEVKMIGISATGKMYIISCSAIAARNARKFSFHDFFSSGAFTDFVDDV